MSDRAPIARDEENWQYYQYCQITKLRHICEQLGVPCFVAGDIFDKWKVSPETVNSTISALQNWPGDGYIHAIPGQHDLPYHSKQDIKKSSYWTLVEAGVVYHTSASGYSSGRSAPSVRFRHNGVLYEVYGMGWEEEWPNPIQKDAKNILFGHKYIWRGSENAYPGAPADGQVKEIAKKLKGFSAAFFGDNHKRFWWRSSKGGVRISNCGCFIRRKIDEKKQEPKALVLMESGKVQRVSLSSHDAWSNNEIIKSAENIDLHGFVELLRDGANDVCFDFAESLTRWLDDHRSIGPAVKRLILECLEGK